MAEGQSTTAISIVIIFIASLFYFFSITHLIDQIKQQTFNKSFLRLIDTNTDGILTAKQIKDFAPCETYDGKKINRQFREFGRKVDLNDLGAQITSKMVVTSIESCVGDVATMTKPSHLSAMKKGQVETEMIDTYDINNDEEIRWSEFHLSNVAKKHAGSDLRTFFHFFDSNHDWKISKKELAKAKVKQLADFLGGKVKRRRRRSNPKAKKPHH